MLKVEIVATIEMILNWWIRKALKEPSATPMAPATIEPDNPIAAADPAEESDCEILHDRSRDGEGNVDTAGDQHHQQADREDDIDRTCVEQVEGVAEREEAVGA